MGIAAQKGQMKESDPSSQTNFRPRKRSKNPFSDLRGQFLEKKWRRTATKALLNATGAVDELCRSVVNTKTYFSSNKVAAEVRRLALTVAVFERSLYAYALRIKKFRLEEKKKRSSSEDAAEHLVVPLSNTSPSPSLLRDGSLSPAFIPIMSHQEHEHALSHPLSSSSSNSPTFLSHSPRRSISNSLLLSPSPPFSPSPFFANGFTTFVPPTPPPSSDALGKSSGLLTDSENDQQYWRHTGGIVVLLHLLSDALKKTRHLLNSLTRHSSFFKYTYRRKWWLIFFLPPLLFPRYLFQTFIRIVQNFLSRYFPSTLSLFNALQHSLLRRVGQFSALWPFLYLFYVFIFIPLYFYFQFSRALYWKLQQLQQLHTRLGVLLRLWHICISILDQEDRESKGQLVPTTSSVAQWMLEKVPPTLDSASWYQSNWQLSYLKYGLDVLYCSVSKSYDIFGTSKLGIPLVLFSAIYYSLLPRRASARCSEILGSPNLQVVKMAWAALDLPPLRWVCSASLLERPQFRNRLLVEKEIFLEKDTINSSNANETLDQTERVGPFKKLKVLLLSASPLDLSVSPRLSFKRSSALLSSPRSQKVIIYLHGGGFISDLRSSHLHVVSAWAKQTDAVILYVDYSLSPENVYPVALGECYDVYKWVTRGGLGFIPFKTIMVGDSTGGNLAAGVCVRSLMEPDTSDILPPTALFLAYPILNLKLNPTPSRSLFMMDAILPMNLLLQCRAEYVPKGMDASSDPCLSPVTADNTILQKFPPTSVMVGGFDPFLDDSIDFIHRLSANGVVCRLRVYPSLPHCFLNFTPILPSARTAVDKAAEWLRAV